jgi:hypothetical protein
MASQSIQRSSRSSKASRVRILSLRRARKILHGVSIYGIAQSVGRPQRLSHTVLKRGKSWECVCEDFIFRRPRGGCKHVKAARALLARRMAA